MKIVLEEEGLSAFYCTCGHDGIKTPSIHSLPKNPPSITSLAFFFQLQDHLSSSQSGCTQTSKDIDNGLMVIVILRDKV